MKQTIDKVAKKQAAAAVTTQRTVAGAVHALVEEITSTCAETCRCVEECTKCCSKCRRVLPLDGCWRWCRESLGDVCSNVNCEIAHDKLSLLASSSLPLSDATASSPLSVAAPVVEQKIEIKRTNHIVTYRVGKDIYGCATGQPLPRISTPNNMVNDTSSYCVCAFLFPEDYPSVCATCDRPCPKCLSTRRISPSICTMRCEYCHLFSTNSLSGSAGYCWRNCPTVDDSHFGTMKYRWMSFHPSTEETLPKAPMVTITPEFYEGYVKKFV